MRTATTVCSFGLGAWFLLSLACSKEEQPPAKAPARDQPVAQTPTSRPPPKPLPPTTYDEPQNTILLSQAQFKVEKDASGKEMQIALAAPLVILRQRGAAWTQDVIEDPDSNVFHKAGFFVDPGAPDQGPGILTIGANAAASGKPATIKLWRRVDGRWTAETLWSASFGGKWDRFRDFEVGDVTGDQRPDIAIATHDQGVVAVLTRESGGWKATELDRKPDTFVHEVELADLDGDGLMEIYATPSEPNRLDGTAQPGYVTSYRYTSGSYQRNIVEEYPLRHVKEILATDLGNGPVLLAAVEAELAQQTSGAPDADKIIVKQYRFHDGSYVGEAVATLPDKLCRFLNAGDVDGDGKPEVIASTHKKGVWMVRPGSTPWQTEVIDRNSTGFEHATTLADLDGDKTMEIYVATDDQHRVRRYRWTGSNWDAADLYSIEKSKFTFGITVGRF